MLLIYIYDSDPQLISSIDTINISSGDNSVYSTKIKNRGIPTNLSSVFSRLVTGIEALDDTIANHASDLIAIGTELNETKDLGGEGLAQLLQITTAFQLDYAPTGSFVTLYPPGNAEGEEPSDSLYIFFKIHNSPFFTFRFILFISWD